MPRSPEKLRLLHVVSAYYPAVRYGGPIRSVHALCAALVERGHEVSVYTTNMDGELDSDVPLDRPVDLDGVQVHYFPVPAFRRLWWSPGLGKRLRASIHNFDLVHLHAIFLWPTYVAARTAERAQVPYVMSPRGMLGAEVIRRKSRYVKQAWITCVEQRSLAHAAGLHVTAEIEGDDARAMGLKLPRIFCVSNGVSWPAAHRPIDVGSYADISRPYALFLSRVNRKKGLDRLIQAWKWISELELVVAGNDDENYLPELQQLAQTEGVADRVRFIGLVDDENKWGLYESAELFILASYSENFGNVVAEAMAMGCPVVLTPEVGLSRLVHEVGAGIVTPGEPRVLAGAIMDLHRDPERRKGMGIAGRQAAIERLSWGGVAGQMEQEYLRILGRT